MKTITLPLEEYETLVKKTKKYSICFPCLRGYNTEFFYEGKDKMITVLKEECENGTERHFERVAELEAEIEELKKTKSKSWWN